jgi:hypothetical protein
VIGTAIYVDPRVRKGQLDRATLERDLSGSVVT